MAKQQLNPLKPADKGETDPDLQALLGQRGTGEQENNNGGSAGEQKPNPTPKPQAPQQPKAPEEKKGNGLVTFYTRVGMPFDPKTGQERPCRKHVVTRTWWLVNKDKLPRLGYNIVKVEGE